jgi:hypothetical protein
MVYIQWHCIITLLGLISGFTDRPHHRFFTFYFLRFLNTEATQKGVVHRWSLDTAVSYCFVWSYIEKRIRQGEIMLA